MKKTALLLFVSNIFSLSNLKGVVFVRRLRRFIIFLLLVAVAVVGYMKASGYQVFTITTGSMFPMYLEGEKILVKPISFDELKVGDVITFKSGSDNVTHMICEINTEDRTVSTIGVHNTFKDVTPVAEDEIVGTVVCTLSAHNLRLAKEVIEDEFSEEAA